MDSIVFIYSDALFIGLQTFLALENGRARFWCTVFAAKSFSG
jgi:hypothetical protein